LLGTKGYVVVVVVYIVWCKNCAAFKKEEWNVDLYLIISPKRGLPLLSP
jgi:hypothetical protein